MLQIGVVGTGIFARDHHLPAMENVVKPVAAFNRTKSKAEDFAKIANIDSSKVYDSLDLLLQDPQVQLVDALLPVQINLEVIEKAVAHKKPIAVEKPVAATLDQAREIVKLSENTDVPVAILEQYPFFEGIDQIRQILPKIGPVVSFSHKVTSPWNTQNKYLLTKWRLNPEHIGGYLSDGGVHQVALFTEILGKVDYVSGHTRQLRQQSGADDILFSTLKLENGIIGTYTYGTVFGALEPSSSLTIFGQNGSLVYDFSPNLEKHTITFQTGPSSQEASKKTVITTNDTPFYGAIKAEIANFAEAVEKNDKSLIKVPPAKAFHHLAVIAAALESSRKDGVSVRVERP